MPIKVKKDIKRKYGFGTRFSLKDIPDFKSGSLIGRVIEDIADQNWKEFYFSWGVGINASRNVSRSIASKFNLDIENEKDTFDMLWNLIRESRAYEKKNTTDVKKQSDINLAYQYLARIANGETITKNTFSRLIDRADDNFVIFSDHHLTAFSNKPNYFRDFNYDLYLKVLDYYSKQDFCVVENGDVEDCVVYEPTLSDSTDRKKKSPKGVGVDEIKFPIKLNNKWADFLNLRYSQRLTNLTGIIESFPDYYELLRTKLISKDKYIKLTGNHDTYLDDSYERVLRDLIENELGVSVHDILRISRNGKIRYLVLHGHQIDSVCLQHGDIPYAKSLGEIFSECLAWAYEGADRVWRLKDTKKWYIGNTINNILAWQIPKNYANGDGGKFDLWAGNDEKIKEDSVGFIEQLMENQIAWEYFENRNAYNAFTLEVWTGDEMYKMRHMNETDFCDNYHDEYSIQPNNDGQKIPTIVLGHTHEPRRNAINIEKGEQICYYLNSGSAGRFENLIWCVEIIGDTDRICSWSIYENKLKRIIWRDERILNEDNKIEVTLIHDFIELIDY